TDSGLLARGVAKLARLTKAIKAAGLAVRTTSRDRTRSVRRRAHEIGAWLRRRNDDAKEEVARHHRRDGRHRHRGDRRGPPRRANARRGLRRAGDTATGKVTALVAELERSADLVERIAAQTRVRLAGAVP